MPREYKSSYVQKAIGKTDLIKFFLQICWEIKSLQNNKYIALSEPLNEVGKMLGGWYRQLSKQNSAKSGEMKWVADTSDERVRVPPVVSPIQIQLAVAGIAPEIDHVRVAIGVELCTKYHLCHHPL